MGPEIQDKFKKLLSSIDAVDYCFQDKITEQISNLENKTTQNREWIFELSEIILLLQESINKKVTYSNDIVISTIEEITYIEDYEYVGEEWEKYLVKLEEYDCYFYLSKRVNSRAKTPKIGDRISHKIDGERIKEWHKLK